MAGSHGKFVWHELMTTDVKAAGAFYGKVFGWSVEGEGYAHINTGGQSIGGIMELSKHLCDIGVRPHWGGYIAVDDVDAYAAKIETAGGKVHKAPDDIPNTGRFAVVADPAGAHFMIFKGATPDGRVRPPMGTPGFFDWNEQYGGDPAASMKWYADLFGWTAAEAMDMGPVMGTYQIFHIAGVPSGGLMKKVPDMPIPMWLYYVAVDDIDAAQKRVTDNGGVSIFGPTEVPGGMWIVHALDPQQALFAMVGPKQK